MNIASGLELSEEMPRDQESFWKGHVKNQKASGLSRKAYCIKHQISYERFGYWARKWHRESICVPEGLLPVRLSRLPKRSNNSQGEMLCTLLFKNGHELKIHDKAALAMLLSAWS